MNRILVVGDIHGGLRALEQVLSRSSVTKKDRLIFLGDFVDGWSESAQVIEYLIELSKNQECYFVKGNHDVWCEEWLRNGKAENIWTSHGGESSIESYKKCTSRVIKKHQHFFERMRMYYIDETNRLFIHAGFTSMHGPEKEFYSSNYGWDRTLWETALSMDERIKKESLFFPKRLKLFKEIFIGHTPTLYYNVATPMNRHNVWNIDTGAAFTGRLSIMDVATKEFWQSDPLPELYKGEKGRNAE